MTASIGAADGMSAQSGDGEDVGRVVLAPSVAVIVARLLELLSELPSTPGLIAEEAAYRAAVVEERLPPPHAIVRSTASIAITRLDAVAIAGLLDLLGEMPSTPPAVADDARDHAASMWKLLG